MSQTKPGNVKTLVRNLRKAAEKRAQPQTNPMNQCGNCLDGKLVMPGETCGVCGNSEPAKRKPRRERQCVECGCTESRACKGGCYWIVKHPKTLTGICSCCHPEPTVQIGSIRLARVSAGIFWLVTAGGEGMQTAEGPLAKALARFFKANF